MEVASFAEAWIEIVKKKENTKTQNVASFAEAWIEIHIFLYGNLVFRRLLRGGVDWNDIVMS